MTSLLDPDQGEDAGHYVHAVEQAVDDLRRFAFASQEGREGLAAEAVRIIEAQRKFQSLAFFLSLSLRIKDEEAAT